MGRKARNRVEVDGCIHDCRTRLHTHTHTQVRTHRRAYRERRQSTPIPVVALVGYTNAGEARSTKARAVAVDDFVYIAVLLFWVSAFLGPLLFGV